MSWKGHNLWKRIAFWCSWLVSVLCEGCMRKREKNVMIDNTLVQGRLNFVKFLVFTSFMFLPMIFFSMILIQVH